MSIKKAYDAWSEIYDHNVNKTRDLDGKVIREVLDQVPFSKVLELGCGTGKNTAWLLEKGATVMAVDFSSGMLAKARNKLDSVRVDFIEHDITNEWNFGDGIFDLITINLVLEHIESLPPIFEKAHRALRPEGHLFICELHPFRQYKGSGAKYEEDGAEVRVATYVHHLSDFTKPALEKGFMIKDLQEWFDENPDKPEPRLVSFLFRKSVK